MKITYFFQVVVFIFPVLIMVSCHSANSPNSDGMQGHLSTKLVNNPRSLNDDTQALSQMGRLQFTDTLHDFGKISEGEVVEYDFEFRNAGKSDILISDAKASCGCTVPSFPKEPLRSGVIDKIKVTFNSQGKEGFNEKLIVVNTNGNPASYNIRIRAEVIEK